MPDWKSYVGQRLKLNNIHPHRQIEITEEVAQQLDEIYQEGLRNGMTQAEATAAAEQHIIDWRQFAREINEVQRRHAVGLVPRAAERMASLEARNSGVQQMVFEFLRDLLYGARALRKNLRFTFIAVLTIAAGIGATTAIFSVIHGVILQPLPYDHPERIVWVWGQFSQSEQAAVSPPDFQDYRSHLKSFEQLAAMHVMHQFVAAPLNLKSSSGPVRFDSAQVSSGFFEVFGARALLGRTFSQKDEQPGSKVVVLSFNAWQNYFGSDPKIIGKTLILNQASYTVIGVIRRGFNYPQEAQMWVPIVFGTPEMSIRRFHFLRPIGRLRPGITAEKAQAEIETIAARLEKQYPESNRTWTAKLEPLQKQITGHIRRPLFVIFAAVSFLLLIACVNVANLLLARISARQKEIAIRVALGARRARIVRQLLAESLLLSLPAGALGFFLAYWSVNIFKLTASGFLPRLQEVTADGYTLAFTCFCSILTAVLISLAPSIDIASHISSETLKEGKGSGSRVSGIKMRNALAVGEVALSLMLLAGAGLLLKSFWKLTSVNPGFRPDKLITVRLSLDENRYPDAKSVIDFVETVTQKIESIPGVVSVGAGTGLPLVPAGGDRFFTIAGKPPASDPNDRPTAQFRSVTENYFRALSISLLRGRSFTHADNETSSPVVVINSAFSRKYLSGSDPIGKILDIDAGKPFQAQIIGIVNSTRQDLASVPEPEMYVIHRQVPMGYLLLAVRSNLPPGTAERAVRSAIHEVDSDLTFPRFRTMDQIIGEAGSRERLNATLLASAAAIALLLAAIGIYGVIAFSVEQRQQEIGVRMALGARGRDIVRMVLGRGVRIALGGLIFGIAGALVLTRLMRSLLFEVSPADPVILSLVCLVLLVVALAASWIPARNATRVDLLSALRYE